MDCLPFISSSSPDSTSPGSFISPSQQASKQAPPNTRVMSVSREAQQESAIKASNQASSQASQMIKILAIEGNK